MHSRSLSRLRCVFVRGITLVLLRRGICSVLLFAFASPLWAQATAERVRDAELRKLAERYVESVRRAEDDQNQDKGLLDVVDSEDRLLSQVSNASEGDKAAVWSVVANGRFELDYRSPVDVAELAIKANVPDAALLALDLGRIPMAMQLLKRPHAVNSSQAYRQIRAVRRLLLEDTPPRKCKVRDPQLCESLYDLLALPPRGYGVGRMRDLEQFAQRTSSVNGDPDDSKSTLGRFLLSDFPPAIKLPSRLTITAREWKTAAIPAATGVELASMFHTGASSVQSEAARVVTIFLAQQALRKLVGTNSSLVNGATQKKGDSVGAEFLTLQDAFSIGERHFLVMRVDSDLSGRIVVIELAAGRPDRIQYWQGEVQAGGLTISPAPLLGASRPFFIVAKTETSSQYLTLWLLDPQARKTTQIFNEEEAYHGTFFTANMRGDGRHHLLVSRSTGDRRYADCNQCPSRVERLVFRMSADGKQIRLVAEAMSWGDIGAGTNANMFGLGPEVARQNLSTEIQSSVSALSAPNISDEEYRDQAAKVADLAAELKDAEAYAEAAAACISTLELLNTNARPFSGSADVFLALRLVAADAYLLMGNVQAAAAQLSRASDESIQDPKLKDYHTQLRLDAARASGGLSKHYDALQAMLIQEPNAATLQSHMADYLLQVGSYEEALVASRKASDARVREQSYWLWDLYATLRAQVRLNRDDDAVTSVALLLRGSATLRSSGLSARALLTAAEIALRTNNLDVAMRLFDAGFARMDSTAWAEDGPAVLLFYSRLLRKTAGPREALQILAIAMNLVDHGSPMFAVLQDETAFNLEQVGGVPAALSASELAFDSILRQQVTVAEEPYKLSFVSSNAEIAERHISRLLRSPTVQAPTLVNAIERWHAQVLRSMRREHKAQGLSDRSPASVISDVAKGDTAYVTYYLAGTHQVALVAERGEFRVVPLTLDAARLERARLTVRGLTDINAPEVKQAVWLDRTPPALKSELSFLHDRLIADLHLNSQIKKVIAVPDERLYWVPWPALAPAGGDGGKTRTLFERLTVLVTPSVLMFTAEEPGPKRIRYLAVGAVDAVPPTLIKAALPDMFIDAKPSAMPALRSARVEVADISETLGRKFGGTVLLLAREGGIVGVDTLNEVMSEMGAATIVHVAAHGIFNSRNPMSSAVFLSGSDEHAVLRPSNLASASLRSVSLLTLSACQTGMSDVRRGAEAIGFVRGAMVGGVHRVMLANWVVEDRATQEFFKEFYTRIGHEQSIIDAYRDGVIELSKRYEHPFYWAGYTMYSVVSP